MKPGDLVRIRPSGWGIYLRSGPLYSSSQSDGDGPPLGGTVPLTSSAQRSTHTGVKVTPHEVLIVLEVVRRPRTPRAAQSEISAEDVRVLTSNGAVGYVSRVRLERIK